MTKSRDLFALKKKTDHSLGKVKQTEATAGQATAGLEADALTVAVGRTAGQETDALTEVEGQTTVGQATVGRTAGLEVDALTVAEGQTTAGLETAGQVTAGLEVDALTGAEGQTAEQADIEAVGRTAGRADTEAVAVDFLTSTKKIIFIAKYALICATPKTMAPHLLSKTKK